MPLRSLRVFLFAACALLLVAWQIANACECAARRTVLDEFDQADEVVILRAVSVEKVASTNERRYVDNVRSTTLVVEKVFKGNLKAGDQIVFGQGGGADCLWTFDEKAVGGQFLFYLKRPENIRLRYPPSRIAGLWFAFACGRSGGVDDVTDDLLYLSNMDKLRGKTRISGSFASWMTQIIEVAGKKIKIIGADKTYETTTDKHGVFEIYDLPPGKYFIEPEAPPGFRIDPLWLMYSPSVIRNAYHEPELRTPRQVAIMLEPKKHAGIDFAFMIEK
jgi:hypothetical protein